MELIMWANGNGQTLKLQDAAEAEALHVALTQALKRGHGNAVLDCEEIDVEIAT